MKYIHVPKDIEITVRGRPWEDLKEQAVGPFSMPRYLENIVFPHPVMGTGYETLKSLQAVGDKFRNATFGDWIDIDPAHWNMLVKAIMATKGAGVAFSVLIQFLPFMDAILDAVDQIPSDAPTDTKN